MTLVPRSNYELFTQELEASRQLGEFLLRLVKGFKSRQRSCLSQGMVIRMTPQEEKFSKFFASEAVLVADMDDIALIAHREELASIAFEARARLHAVDEETRTRTKNKKFTAESDPNQGEDLSSDAINSIKERQKKMSKMDKVKKSLMAMGVSEKEAEGIINARNIRDNSPSRVAAGTTGSVNPFNPFEKVSTSPVIPTFNPVEEKPKLKPGEIDWDKVVEEAKAKEAKEAELAGKPFVLPKFS